MRKLHKALVATGLGLAVLVPTGMALADDVPSAPTPVCTPEQRAEHQTYRDQVRAQLQDQGVTDPVELRAKVREAMEATYGDLPGRQADGTGGAMHRSGARDGTDPRADRPMDGAGNAWGLHR